MGNFIEHLNRVHIDKKTNIPDDIVVDFIAGMTDDYFIEVFKYLYPDHELNKQIKYIKYFDKQYL